MLTWACPPRAYDEGSITADVDGVPVYDISSSGFQGSGPGVDAGVAIGLGSETITARADGHRARLYPGRGEQAAVRQPRATSTPARCLHPPGSRPCMAPPT